MVSKLTYWKGVVLAAAVFFLPAGSAFAQIDHLTPADQKARAKKSKKEAAQYPADHKETHLDTEHYTLKRGHSGRKRVRVVEDPVDYNYDKEINTIYEEPKATAKKKKKPARKSKKQ